MDMLNKYYKAAKTILEMAYDRGYMNKIALNKTIFKTRYEMFVANNSGALDIHFENRRNKLVVSFLDGNKPEKQIIKRCERLIKANELKTSDDIVIVYNNIDEDGDEMSENAKIKIRFLEKDNLKIFSLNELQFNFSRHFLVPKHIRLDNLETKRVVKLYRLQTKQQLPYLLTSDSQCRYNGFRVGEIVKIIRQSRTSGTSISYRYVVLDKNEDNLENIAGNIFGQHLMER